LFAGPRVCRLIVPGSHEALSNSVRTVQQRGATDLPNCVVRRHHMRRYVHSQHTFGGGEAGSPNVCAVALHDAGTAGDAAHHPAATSQDVAKQVKEGLLALLAFGQAADQTIRLGRALNQLRAVMP
jgi:hypothetical protein